MGKVVWTVFHVVLVGSTIWYFHEYHTKEFIRVSRNIPYLNTIMIKAHSLFVKSKVINGEEEPDGLRIFTVEQLRKYDGREGSKGLYIAIMGKVFDVKKGSKHYGPGGTYHGFAGRDNSQAFVTGDFSDERSSDDIINMSYSDLLSLIGWAKFYEKDYVYRGRVIGLFYDRNGDKTAYHKEVESKLLNALEAKAAEKNEKEVFPPCNVEWDRDKGSRVWCTTKSGGITRDWSGVPRKLYQVGADSFKCVCVNLAFLDNPESPQYARRKHMEVYEDCHPHSRSCYTK